MSTLPSLALALSSVAVLAVMVVLVWPAFTLWVEIGVAVVAPIVAEAARQYNDQRAPTNEEG